MRFIYLILLSSLVWLQPLGATVTVDPGADLYPNIKKVSDGLYVAQMPGHDLRLVMERVDSRNIDLWKTYICWQSCPWVVRRVWCRTDKNGKQLQGGTVADGSNHFKMVLSEAGWDKNEIWVAYITAEQSPVGIPAEMSAYSASDIYDLSNAFAAGVKMFVTITSNPEALVTSHMGIAASAESTGNRPKGISVDLHSFGAKVMRMRNPQRRYMINAPVWEMEKIMIDGLPQGSVFVGTREMQKGLEAVEPLTYEDFIKSPEAELIAEKMQSLMVNWKAQLPEILESIRVRCQNDPSSLEESMQYFLKKCREDGFQVVDDQFVVCPEALQKKIEEDLQYKFRLAKRPYDIKRIEEGLLPFMKKCPPLLSVDGDNGMCFEKTLKIYDSQTPSQLWLTVGEHNKDTYAWLFAVPFQPAGCTHYIAVDLVRLADAKAVEPVK